jgi:hypothetical protein
VGPRAGLDEVEKQAKLSLQQAREARLQGTETSRFPHCLDNRLTYGCEAVSRMCQPAAVYPWKVPGTHFC